MQYTICTIHPGVHEARKLGVEMAVNGFRAGVPNGRDPAESLHMNLGNSGMQSWNGKNSEGWMTNW